MTAWRQRLAVRADAAGLRLSSELADGLLIYLALLAKWNRRINLTAFDLSHPSDEALDRLIVEPVLAAAFVEPGARRAIDLGSGGGSPGVPLALAAPWVEMCLVEVRSRKAAFLREAARSLPQVRIRVEDVRFESLVVDARFDVLSFRAVRADDGLWATVDRLLSDEGRVLWFGGIGHQTESAPVLAHETVEPLTDRTFASIFVVRPNHAEDRNEFNLGTIAGRRVSADVVVLERASSKKRDHASND